MMTKEIITSTQNALVKEFLRLRKKRERKKEELFLLEGFQELSLALQAQICIETLLYSSSFFQHKGEEELLKKVEKGGGKIYPCSDILFRKISGRESPDGLIGLAKSIYLNINDLKNTPSALFLLVENVEKPGNLGALLRSAEAAGVQGVLVVDEGVDIYNPNVIRSSMGALFSVPIVVTSSLEALHFLKREKIPLFAATPEAPLAYTQADLSGTVAFIVGREHEGLSAFWKKEAHQQISIPMRGTIDSLNVAMCATLLLFEARRQQHGS